MGKHIGVIGHSQIGRIALAEALAKHHTPLLHVVDSQFAEPTEPKVFEITRLPELKEPWIDPNESIPNYRKHYETCAKNRKKRKRKKRR